jgi:hypothetical protein
MEGIVCGVCTLEDTDSFSEMLIFESAEATNAVIERHQCFPCHDHKANFARVSPKLRPSGACQSSLPEFAASLVDCKSATIPPSV